MKPVYMLCAEGIIVDQRSNNVSLYNILEEIASLGFPLFMAKFFAICLFKAEDGDAEENEVHFEIKLDDNILFTASSNMKFQGRPRSRAVLEVQGLVIPSPGNLRVSLLKDGVTLAFNEVTVKKIGPLEAPVGTVVHV